MDQILQILIQNGYLDEAGAKDLADLAKTESKPIRQLVIDQGVVDEDSLLSAMAAYQDTEAIDLGAMTIESEVTEAIPASTARMYNVFPIATDESSAAIGKTLYMRAVEAGIASVTSLSIVIAPRSTASVS